MNSKVVFRRLLLAVAVSFVILGSSGCGSRKIKTETKVEQASFQKSNAQSDSSKVVAKTKAVSTSTTTNNKRKKYTRKTVTDYDLATHAPIRKTVEEQGEVTDTMKNNLNTNIDNGYVQSDSHTAKNSVDSSKTNTENSKDLKVSGNRLAIIVVCIAILALIGYGVGVWLQGKNALKNVVKSAVVDTKLIV